MSCQHNDCFTCPYKDCISEKDNSGEKKRPGRKKMNPEVVRQNRLRYQREYYQQHRDKLNEINKQYYRDHADELREKQREYRSRKLQYISPLSNIWITDGQKNKRIKPGLLDEYIKKGWKRGRTNR